MKYRRSNSGDVRQEIQSHILDCIELEESYNTLGETLERVIFGFNKWWDDHKQIKNHQEAFTAYLLCLPSEFSVEFETYSIGQRLQTWLGTSDRNYEADDEARLYYWLIYREFNALCRKHKVRFL